MVVGKEEGFIPISWARELTDKLRANHVEVAERVEELINYGDAASIPDATGAGKLFWEQDTDILKFDDGAWEAVGGVGEFLPLTGGTMSGDIKFDDGDGINTSGAHDLILKRNDVTVFSHDGNVGEILGPIRVNGGLGADVQVWDGTGWIGAVYMNGATNMEFGDTTKVAKIKGTRAILDTPNSSGASLTNGSVAMYLDESGHNLIFEVKYSDGTTKTGTLALA